MKKIKEASPLQINNINSAQVNSGKKSTHQCDSAPDHIDVIQTTLKHMTFCYVQPKTPHTPQSDQGDQDRTTRWPCSNMWKCNAITDITVL